LKNCIDIFWVRDAHKQYNKGIVPDAEIILYGFIILLIIYKGYLTAKNLDSKIKFPYIQVRKLIMVRRT